MIVNLLFGFERLKNRISLLKIKWIIIFFKIKHKRSIGFYETHLFLNIFL